MKNLLVLILITPIGKYAYYKNNFCIRKWRKCRDENPSLDEYIKFVQWKLEDNELSDSDQRIIESILLYESE